MKTVIVTKLNQKVWFRQERCWHVFFKDCPCKYLNIFSILDCEFDPKTAEALDKLVSAVISEGLAAEEDIKARNKSNSAYW